MASRRAFLTFIGIEPAVLDRMQDMDAEAGFIELREYARKFLVDGLLAWERRAGTSPDDGSQQYYRELFRALGFAAASAETLAAYQADGYSDVFGTLNSVVESVPKWRWGHAATTAAAQASEQKTSG